MVGRRNAHGSRSCFGTWIACACASLCLVSPNLSAQTRSVTPPPAVAPAQAPPVCAAPTAADRVTPGRVIASPGDIAGRSGTKPGANTGANAGANARQWTVQVASFESLLDAQSNAAVTVRAWIRSTHRRRG